jgi:hypothetical protein
MKSFNIRRMNMKVGLIDVDSHNFPNLALMKISAAHKAKGHDVELLNLFSKYDLVYQSKIFTFTDDFNYIPQTEELIKGHRKIKDLQRWVNNKIIFRSCERFEDYKISV